MVIGVRKARSEDKTVVRCAPSTRSPSSQVHVVDEDWLFDGKNVDKVVFGFMGGRFSSDGLTAEVKDTVTVNGILQGA